MSIARPTTTLACAGLLTLVLGTAGADDTDIYLNPSLPTGAEPLVMFTLDYRSNLGSTACSGGVCDGLIAEGYLPEQPSYTFFDVLRAALKKVLDPLDGVKVGFMMSHADSCTGGTTAGPGVTRCSNGGYVLYGFHSMRAGSDDPESYQRTGEDTAKLALFDKLDAVPTPGGTLNHSFQGKELYFEFFRYLTGQGIYNGHVGYEDFGDRDRSTNLNVDYPGAAWDTSVEADGRYVTPLTDASVCARIFVVNFLFQVSSQEDDSDAAITASKAAGGMAGINLSGRNNNFETVIRYLHDADLADGSFGTAPGLEGDQSVTSYFLVDPRYSAENQKGSDYARAGGTGGALELSEDPEELIATLESIFRSILSVSTTFVAPSVPVNVFNRAQIVNELFLALFEADDDGRPLWCGNLKKLRIAQNERGESEVRDARGQQAIDIDGRIKREAVTFWTRTADLPEPGDDEVPGADGRAVARGGAGQKVPGYISGSPGATNAAAGARQLYTEDPSDATDGLMPLNADATTAAALWVDITAKWDPPPTSASYAGATAAERDRALAILRFARGLTDDGAGTRSWILGDPLHSRPKPINYGARATGYDRDNPDIRVLVASNDGYLHMFRNTDASGAQDGSERWAFMPRAVIPEMARLHAGAAGGSPVHPITVDGSPTAYVRDANHDGAIATGGDDRVYAYVGLRRGGKRYYALDLTAPDAPRLMWSIGKGETGTAFAELGQTWSTPQAGEVAVGSDVLTVLAFGGGYNGDDDGDNLGDLGKDSRNRATRAGTGPSVGADDDEGNALFLVNAETGALIWKAVQGSSGYSEPTLRHPGLLDSIPADVAAVDMDGDRLLDRIYFADTGGVLWRADLAGAYDHDGNPDTPDLMVKNEPSRWTVTPILSVGRHAAGHTGLVDDRRFFARPDVVKSRDSVGPFDGLIIGSGDREDPHGTQTRDGIYLVKDRAVSVGRPPVSVLADTDLADLTDNCLQTDSCASAPDLGHGWRIELQTSGEKSLANPLTVGGNIFFTTYAPTPPEGVCTMSEGQGRLYAVTLADARALMNFDTTNDVSGVIYERSDLLESGGIPVEAVPLGEGLILIQGEEAGQNVLPVAGRTGFKTYWHEIFH
jgi:type IV pilus assembly protein PilY1